MTERERITEDWLKEVGFKWHQLDRQPGKHWLLWCGNTDAFMGDTEDIGIEVTTMQYRNRHDEIIGEDAWFVWFRGDSAGHYHRFIHVRHMRFRDELIKLVEAVTGQDWNIANHWYGSVVTPARAERNRLEEDRLDRRLLRDGPKWYDIEKDDSRGRALPEHVQENINRGGK